MDDLRLSHHYDKLHGGQTTKSVLFSRLPNPWDISAIHVEVGVDDDDESNGTHVNLADAIRLRDWLTQVIDAAGSRPLHPMVRFQLDQGHFNDHAFAAISDALYELDALKAGST